MCSRKSLRFLPQPLSGSLWLSILLCAGACSDGTAADARGGAGAGGADSTSAQSAVGVSGGDSVAAGASGPGYVPDFCNDAGLQGYCRSSGCPPLSERLAALREDSPDQLFVLPCGAAPGDAGASDAGRAGARYVVVSVQDGTNTDTSYYDAVSGQVVAADSFFVSPLCPPGHPSFGQIPRECVGWNTSACPPSDAGADFAAHPYACLLTE